MAPRKKRAVSRKCRSKMDSLASEYGRRGGKARMAQLSAKERKELARHAAWCRWCKPKSDEWI